MATVFVNLVLGITVRRRSADNTLHITGIGQESMPAPADYSKACLWAPPRHNVRMCRTCDFPFDVMRVNISGQIHQLGYTCHAGCWVLMGRILERALVEANLAVFTRALDQFWSENMEDMNYSRMTVDERYHDYRYYHPIIDNLTRVAQPVSRDQDPVNIPEIRDLIDQHTTRDVDVDVVDGNGNGNCSQYQKLSGIAQVPVEIAMMIVDAIYYNKDYGLRGVRDTRNLLIASQWALPCTYWQRRCKCGFIFEVGDLIKEGVSVDWPSLCLGLEELLLDHNWYAKSALRNRGRVLRIMNGIKEVFVDMLDNKR